MSSAWGLGSERVRPRRLPLIGEERAMVERLVQYVLATVAPHATCG